MVLMTNNQWRCDENRPEWAERGEDCSAGARIPVLCRAYLQVSPDLLGLQEVSPRQAELTMAELSRAAAYEYVSGGDTPIVYRRDKLKLLESGFLRFPESVPGLAGSFNNSETKSFCWGVFENRADQKRIAFLSAHLWYKSGNPAARYYQAGSAEARAYQIGLASAKMDEVMDAYGCPGVIVGDLNASVHSRCLERAFSLGWREAHDLATGDRSETQGFHLCNPHVWSHPAERGSFERAIDHILIKGAPGAEILYCRRIEEAWLDPCTDHYPLYCEIRLGPEDVSKRRETV